jgi:hypothetical protein
LGGRGAGGAVWEAGGGWRRLGGKGRQVGFVGMGGRLKGGSGRSGRPSCPIWLCRAFWLRGARQTFFAVRPLSTAHDKVFFIYLYFNFIIEVSVLKLSNGKENLL